MIEIKADPYVLRPRPDVIGTETIFRSCLDVSWCKGVLFNVVALKSGRAAMEYDAVLWDDDNILFIEYKDTRNALQALQAKKAQMLGDRAGNIARKLGFKGYNFTIVANVSSADTSTKSWVPVITLSKLPNYKPEYMPTRRDIEKLDEMVGKYSAKGMKDVVKDLKSLKKEIEKP